MVAVLDDKAARRAARTLEIPVTGTLGIVVTAADMKLLPSVGRRKVVPEKWFDEWMKQCKTQC
jgi:predicted nucleic acid-binding protein